MAALPRFRFDRFEIDARRRLLLCEGAPVALTSKAFDTLLALVERRGEVVEKEALMRRLWPDTAVEEGNLTQQISTVRKALGEAPDDHRFIVTVARRGYRFVSPISIAADATTGSSGQTMGRDVELAELRRAFAAAASGSGQLVCVSGEPGIGKSALVAGFLAGVASAGMTLQGRCSERLAPGEPHLPVLEALEGLLRDGHPSVATVMAARAPSWHAQVAPLVGDIDGPPPHPTGASQERQKRELATCLAELAQTHPLVLFLDDLHWADVSTLDLLVYLTTRLESARVLLIAAYRPGELQLAQEPFVQSLRDLRAKGRVRDVALGFLSREDVEGYLAAEFPDHRFPGSFPLLVHERTEGNPLFLVELLRDLRERGALARASGTWTLALSLEDIARDVPASVRGLIERMIERLDDGDRRLLVAGSVQGAEFDSSVLARALSIDAALVEERLDRLARVHGLIRLVAQHESADRLPNLRYAFVHVLYQDALYASLMPSRRAALSGAIGDALRVSSAHQPGKTAHQMALLFEAARRPEDAVDAFLAAARQAVSVSAGREAAAMARRGLALAATLPATPPHLGRELQLLITLGIPLAATTGYANPEVERTYSRARALCEELGAADALFPVLWGQWVLYHVRAQLPQAIAAAEQLLALGDRTADARMLEVAHTILGYTRGHMGELQAALDHLTRAESLGAPSHQPFYQSINALDPSVAGLCQQGRVLCLLGETDRAREQADRGLALARSHGVPNAIGFALVWSAYVHQLRLEPGLVTARTEEALSLAAEHGLADVRGWAAVWHAWASDDPEPAATVIRGSLEAQRHFGSEIARPHQLGLLADVLIRAGAHAEASTTLDEALAHASRTGDRYYEPELHRLKGDAALALAGPDPAATAHAHYLRAIDTARRQGGRLFEQRVAVATLRRY